MLIKLHWNIFPASVALSHGLERRSMDMYFSSWCVIYKLQHLRSKPVTPFERVKVNIEGIV